MERLPLRRHIRRLSLLTIAVILITILPNLYHPAEAASSFRPLDDSQAEFSQGNFQRTAISAGKSSAFNDKDGVLQLAAVGALNPWTISTPLPMPLGSPGIATIGNRLYTVAGATTGQGTGQAFTNAVYWASANQQTGAFKSHDLTTPPPGADISDLIWVNDPLPSATAFMSPSPDANCTTEVIQGRRAPAVATLVTGSGTDYIYAIGGAFKPSSLCTLNTMTSPIVQIGAVNATSGDINWSDSQTNYLPSPSVPGADPIGSTATLTGKDARGVEGATAAIIHTASGPIYLYVIGGLASNFFPDGSFQGFATPAVFYTRLNPTTGALQHPTDTTSLTPWARTTNVPVTIPYGGPGDFGLFNHTAIVSRATVGSGTGTTFQEAIYVTGGYTEYKATINKTANAAVFRATLADEATGALTWRTDFNPPSQSNISMDIQRGDTAGFAYGSKLYVIGGRDKNTSAPLSSISTGLHDDNLNMLPLFSGLNSEYFIGGVGATPVIANAVYGLGAAVIPAIPLSSSTTAQNTAWGYAIGGYDASGAPTAQIYRGSIGGEDETTATQRAPEGWYYSRFFNIQLDSLDKQSKIEARVLSIRWSAEVTRTVNTNADLYIEFRRTKLLPCDDAAFAASPWNRLDADGSTTPFYSQAGAQANRVLFRDAFPNEDPNATCVQYRVKMTQNGSTGGTPNAPGVGGSSITPKLFKIEVETSEPYDPDLQVNAFEISTNALGQIDNLNLKIINLNGVVANTVAADVVEFPVVLCVAYSATGPIPLTWTPPTLPIVGDADKRTDCAPAYRFISGAWTVPGQVLFLNSDKGWRINFDNTVAPGTKADDLVNALSIFNTPGYYAVAALIDPFNLVTEGGGGKANNSGENLNNGLPLIRRFQIQAARLPDAPNAIPVPQPDPPIPDPPNPTPTPTPDPNSTPTPTPTSPPTPNPLVDNSVYLPMVVR